ncbi:MAG: AMP-binding protein [Rhodospirillales bacterium]|nr:AMP-binding protein [Rhodospirillales bacterium]
MQVGRCEFEMPTDTLEFPSIIHSLDYAADHAPDRLALICEDKSIDFAGYRRAVGGMAALLEGRAGKGDRAAVLMTNSIDMAVALLGAMAAGLQTAPLNPALTDRELIPLLEDTDPSVLFCDAGTETRARALAAGLGIDHVLCSAGGFDIWALAADRENKLPDQLPAPDDRAAMFFTGGTTGIPKGAEHSHYSLSVYAPLTHALWKFNFDDQTILNVAPMFHVWGHQFTLVFPLYLRATMVIVPAYSPKLVLQELERNRVTVFAGGPAAIFLGLLAAETIDSTDLSALEYSIAGGSACSEGLLARWQERTGNEILEGWGMSEGAPINSNPTHGVKKRLSTGPTAPRTEIDIVDLETGTQVLAQGEKGEIRLRGPQFTIGYRNKPIETAAAIRDGWLYTGDIGYFDEDGYMFLVDRKKEMIIVGGFNVYPREIDEVLANHPAVAEAAAVGAPDDFSGEVVRAFVALVPGGTASEQELLDYCAENLVKYKIPKSIEILGELPKKGPGKIDKMTLKARAAEE